jgi:Rieske Fe-S protein
MSEKHESVNERRAFLRNAAIAAAGAVAGSAVAQVARADELAPVVETPAPSRPLMLKEHTELQKIGGWKLLQNGAEKLIVARTDENSFVACSAICTHKGCEVEYVHGDKAFACPCHGARFDLQGNVLRGPAKRPLARHNIDAAALLEIAPAAAKSEGK